MLTGRSIATDAARILLLALAYFVAGRIGLLLAIPPGYASAIFPPTGIAVGALLIWGTRLWPGVLLGSALMNFSLGLSPDTPPIEMLPGAAVAVAIGGGAALQAVVGASLIRRFIGYPLALVSNRDIVLFFLFAGPVSCTLSALVGNSMLVMAGVSPPDNFFYSAFNWWVGDVIGAVIVTPLMLLAFGRPRAIWRARRRFVAIPTLLVAAVVVFGYWLSSAAEQQRLRANFAEAAQVVPQRFQERLARIGAGLDAVARIVAALDVDPESFRSITRQLVADPGVRAVGWAPRLPAEARATFERQIRETGVAGYRVFELAPDGSPRPVAPREWYLPVTYVATDGVAGGPYGLDIVADPVRRAAVERARRTGRASATAPIALAGQQDVTGILVLQPVVAESGRLDDPFIGAVVAALAVPTLLEDVFAQTRLSDARLVVTDITGGAEQALFGAAEEAPESRASLRLAGIEFTRVVDVAGRTWRFEMIPTLAYLGTQTTWIAYAVLASGLTMLAMLLYALLAISGRNFELNSEREKYLDVYDNSPEMFASVDMASGRIVECNKALVDALGRSAKGEVLGRRAEDLYHPDCRDAYLEARRLFQNTGSVVGRELLLMRADGTPIPVLTNASARRDEAGQILYSRVSWTDLTELKASEQVAWEKQFLELVIQNMSEGVAIFDEKFNHVISNATASRLARMASDPDPRAWGGEFGLFHAGGKQRIDPEELPVMRALAGDPVDNQEYFLRHPDSPEGINIVVNASPVLDAARRIRGAVLLFRDITEEKRNSETLQLRTDQLLRSNKELEDFAYIVSHDLQAPLRHITMFSEVLEEELGEKRAEGVDEALGVIRGGTQRMHDLIQDLLKYSRASFPDTDKQAVDCTALANEVVAMLAGEITEKGAAVKVGILPSVYGNETRLLQLFQNLIENALKYSRPGESPRVEVEGVQLADQCEFVVRDHGIGLAEEHYEKIFGVFEKLHKSSEYPGTGIGLAVCQKIVKGHGGRIWVECSDSGGTEFHFTIVSPPVARAATA